MTYTLGAHALGTVTSEDSTKDAGLFQMPMPASDSSSAILIDLFGAFRTITIDGIWTSSDGTISTFVQWLDSLVNGSQISVAFVSDKSGVTYNVLVGSVNWKSEEGGVNKVNYTITLLEGSV